MNASDVLLYLLLDLAIIIVAARSLGALARRFGQPAVVGEIVAGILLGPSVLGRVVPAAPAALFPPEVPLRSLADLGLVFFMFLVGLELDPGLIRKEGRRAAIISLGGVALPFGLGVLISLPLFPLNNAGSFVEGVTQAPSHLPFSLFMGAAMCITAFPVLARILVERGLYRSPMGTSALCAAAVDDVIAWILLAAVVGIARTGSGTEALGALGLTVVFALLMATLGRALLARLARRSDASGRLTVDQVAIVMVSLFLSAYATERIGIHSIFGAFVLGAIMPHGSQMTRQLTDKIEDLTVVVLLPAFFAIAGLRTNLFSLNSTELLAWTVLIVLAATVGKMAGCGFAARLTGYSTRDSFALGTLMNTRGLTELVILSVGLGLGVLSDRTFAMMVIMALVTTFMAAPIINHIMPRREMVRVLAGGDPGRVRRRILVALGNPENTQALVGAGVAMAGSDRPAELLITRLIPTPRAPEFRTGLKDEEVQIDRSLHAMNGLIRLATDAGLDARLVSFLSDDVGQDLVYVADTQRCDAVLLGWHRPSLDHKVIRALVHRVFELAPCDAVVFLDRWGQGLRAESHRPVLVAEDGAEGEAAARRTAAHIAERFDSAVVTLPVGAGNGGRAPQRSGEDGVTAGRSTADATVLVVATGPTWSAESEFGEPATELARVAECPVLVVRPAVRPESGARGGVPAEAATA
jgi:Kef-type K+ transport system membrane component KefB